MKGTIYIVERRRDPRGAWSALSSEWFYTVEDAEREIAYYRRTHALEPAGRDEMRVVPFVRAV